MTADVLMALASGTTVVTANNRQARNIRLAYDGRQAAAGQRVWRTAQILPWDAWLRTLWDAAVLPGEPRRQRRVLSHMQVRLAWQDLMPALEAASGGATSAAAARLAAETWKTCRAWDIDAGTLRREADSRDGAIFVEWSEAYERHCAARNWLDPASVADHLVTLLPGLPAQEFVFTGFESLDPQQQRLLTALGTAGFRITHVAPARTPATDVLGIPCSSPEEELAAAAAWARSHKERAPTARIAVVAADLSLRADDVRRAFLDVLAPDWRRQAPVGSPVNVSYGTRLGETGAVHAALLALSLLRGAVDYRDAGQILRSKFIGDIVGEGRLRAVADLALRGRIGGRIAPLALAEAISSPGLALADGLRSALRRVPNPSRRQLPSAWARIFAAVLADLKWPGTAPVDSSLHQVLNAWQGCLDVLAGCDGVVGKLTCGAALSCLRQTCDDEVFQPQGPAHGVEVLGLLEALGQEFDALWITGLTATRWPPAARPNPLLPLGLQRKLGIPGATPESARQLAEGRLRELLASAPEVRLSWPGHDGDEACTPSPFIAAVKSMSLAALGLCAGQGAIAAQQRVRAVLIEAADVAPPVTGRRLPGGTRLLALQARCPARAFFEIRLGARESVVPAPGIVPEIRGKVLHAVLERFFGEVTSSIHLHDLPAERCREMIGAFLDTELGRILDARDPFEAVLLTTERALLAGRIMAHLEDERTREPYEIVHIEAESEAPVGSFTVRVRPDRVDRLADGSLLVIDYKTGRFSASDWNGVRPKAPQLPLYAGLLDADAIAAVCIRRGGARWYAAGGQGIRLPGGASRKADKDDWTTRRGDWHDAILRLADEIRRGDCRINRWDRELAGGEWTMLTRVHEATADEPDEEDDE